MNMKEGTGLEGVPRRRDAALCGAEVIFRGAKGLNCKNLGGGEAEKTSPLYYFQTPRLSYALSHGTAALMIRDLQENCPKRQASALFVRMRPLRHPIRS